MKIIVDAMGGDNAPGALVQGALEANRTHGVDISLVGRAAGAPGLLAGLTGIFSAGFLTLWGLYFPLALAARRRIALEYQRTQ